MIADYLATGSDRALSARYLATLLRCSTRDITAGIERERRRGLPICASCNPERPGYYLAETAEELRGYCDQLERRAGEIDKTRIALLKAAAELPTREA